MFVSVLNRCLYNAYDKRGSLNFYNANIRTINETDLQKIENYLNRAKTWISLAVHYAIGIFTDNENVHKVYYIS